MTVDSLTVPCLVEVDGGVFAVAEAQCTKPQDTVFTGIASQLLTITTDNERMEVLEDAEKDTQVLEEVTSTQQKKRVDVIRPTAVVEGSNIYMLVGKHTHEDAANCKSTTATIKSGMLLVRGQVGGEDVNKIHWNYTDGLSCTLFGEHLDSLTGLIGGGGSGIKMQDGTLVFPVEATKKTTTKEDDIEETGISVSLILYWKDNKNWKMSKETSADGCSDPSVVEWKDKLMMMTACVDGRRRVYESGDKGESWTEALGTLSRVWGKKKDENVQRVRSGFITAPIGDGEKNVMLVTLPVYSKKENEKGKGVLHLWLTDNTHIADIGPVSEEEENVTASSLLYKGGNNGDNEKKDELIALYEKEGDEEKPSPGMASVRLTEQLKRVKEVLTTWKEVDERVSQLCPTVLAHQGTSSGSACSDKITDGLVGFLSGNLSDGKWKDEYLGVNATVKGVAEMTDNGLKFEGVWAEWPVGSQGPNQLYHFANYNFTLVATVSVHNVPKGNTRIPLMGVWTNDGDKNTVVLGLSYNKEKRWSVLCSGANLQEQSSSWDPQTRYQVAIVLQNSSQGSVYVDGERVGNEGCALEITDSTSVSHFYIGGDGGNTKSQGVSVTVENVLLYNRPLNGNEITALNAIKDPILKPEDRNKLAAGTLSPEGSGAGAEGAVLQSTPGEPQRMEQELLKGVVGADGRGVSSAASTAATPSSNDGQMVAAGSGDTMQGEGIQPQVRKVNATAPNSSLGNMSRGNNTGDAGTMRGSGLLPPLLLLLGLWGFAAL
ncbi:trans-sialidase, putative [Trypanosoma cruzi marinkellei]|uniref:Trans-sialidase, putative n=1 Tax=Trypanosoma cruzi marinkellei TaxID=85056 RepID=K2NKH7_TRYCR|nr:trans-sialidase, putative [Trypanosoma cruzi marinkellei]